MEHAHSPSSRAVDLASVAPKPYRLSGAFLEACDCYTICPCWVGRPADGGGCAGVLAWSIEKGEIDGVDVSGRTLVSASIHPDAHAAAGRHVVFFVDDGADERAMPLLAEAFSGALGGPLGDLARIVDAEVSIERAPIAITRAGRTARLSVGRVIDVETAAVVNAKGAPMALKNGALGGMLEADAEVGIARRIRVGMPWLGFDIDLGGRSAMQGRFDYAHGA
jgi:hypothetical protein